MSQRPFIEGYAIVSADGMLADAAGRMPPSLKFEADQRYFRDGLDRVEVVVHGRHSHEQQKHSPLRRRVIMTRRVAALAPDPSNAKALFWNPAGASFEEALAVLRAPDGAIGVIGGTEVFDWFLDRYDAFHLSRAPHVRLPGGRPVFRDVPARSPEDVLARHGLEPGSHRVLDQANGIAVVSWVRRAQAARGVARAQL